MLFIGRVGNATRSDSSQGYQEGRFVNTNFILVKSPYCVHPHPWSLNSIKKETCVDWGFDEWVCNDCGQVVDFDKIPPTGHKFREQIVQEPTCTEPGTKNKVCDNCGLSIEEEIEPLGHRWETTHVRRKPTCEIPGLGDMVCSACGESRADSEIPPLGHDWMFSRTIKEATCTEPGKYEMMCKRCGKVKIETSPEENHMALKFPGEVVQKGKYDPETGKCVKPTIIQIRCNKCNEIVERFEYGDDLR